MTRSDRQNPLAIPGFVDLQVNGYLGVDFSSPELTPESFTKVARALIDHGTAMFLPTIITSSEELFKRNLKLISECMEQEELKRHLPGIHVEGPFISPEDGARGAHNRDWVREPDTDLLDRLQEWAGGKIKLLTIAAEPEGADELCRHANRLGITVSLGHQLAGNSEISKLADAGARALTHLGNGMPAMIHRHDNPLWGGLAEGELTIMFISDGHHLPDTLIRVYLTARPLSHLVVVSDASPIAGYKPGRYNTLGNDVILEENGRLWNPSTGYLVGSSFTMLECMNYLGGLNLLTLDEMLKVGYENPLRLIGVDPEEAAGPLPKQLTASESDQGVAFSLLS